MKDGRKDAGKEGRRERRKEGEKEGRKEGRKKGRREGRREGRKEKAEITFVLEPIARYIWCICLRETANHKHRHRFAAMLE